MKAILHDVRRCRGCMKCVEACRVEHGFQERDSTDVCVGGDLSATRFTTLAKIEGGHFVRQHCVHCLEPGCVTACLVGALVKTPEGPVIYDETKCIGCRYCMIACPFEVPRYEWDSLLPLVRKCDLCFDRPGVPACVEACPYEATMVGDRAHLLEVAHQRIQDHPGDYVPHVWGEHEAGGTSVLFVSDVSLDDLWPTKLGTTSIPDLTLPLARTAPVMFGSILAVLTGLSWVVHRRNRVAAESAPETSNEAEGNA